MEKTPEEIRAAVLAECKLCCPNYGNVVVVDIQCIVLVNRSESERTTWELMVDGKTYLIHNGSLPSQFLLFYRLLGLEARDAADQVSAKDAEIVRLIEHHACVASDLDAEIAALQMQIRVEGAINGKEIAALKAEKVALELGNKLSSSGWRKDCEERDNRISELLAENERLSTTKRSLVRMNAKKRREIERLGGGIAEASTTIMLSSQDQSKADANALLESIYGKLNALLSQPPPTEGKPDNAKADGEWNLCCPECGEDSLSFLNEYANGVEHRCNSCGHTFMVDADRVEP